MGGRRAGGGRAARRRAGGRRTRAGGSGRHAGRRGDLGSWGEKWHVSGALASPQSLETAARLWTQGYPAHGRNLPAAAETRLGGAPAGTGRDRGQTRAERGTSAQGRGFGETTRRQQCRTQVARRRISPAGEDAGGSPAVHPEFTAECRPVRVQ